MGVLTASIREMLKSPTTLPIVDEIESAEYIYVLLGKEARIALFNRQGHFLRTFLQQGQGPDDFRGMIGFIQTDEENNGDIFVTDIFETPRRYYLRMILNEKYYVASVDKKNGETVVEKCDIPDTSAQTLSDINMQLGMVGSKGYKQFPMWGRVLDNNLAQVVMPYEIEMYKEQTEITIPQELQKRDMDGNPIFVIYKLNKYH